VSDCAHYGLRFDHDDIESGLLRTDCRGQPARPAADNYEVHHASVLRQINFLSFRLLNENKLVHESDEYYESGADKNGF
jgi:hypothetical protein